MSRMYEIEIEQEMYDRLMWWAVRMRWLLVGMLWALLLEIPGALLLLEYAPQSSPSLPQMGAVWIVLMLLTLGLEIGRRGVLHRAYLCHLRITFLNED